MNRKPYRDILDSAAADSLSRNVNLWARITPQFDRRKNLMMKLRARPVLMVLLVLLALALLSGAAYALGRLTGFIPGIGFVETSSLRVLSEPVAVTRDGITVSVEQVIADSERTVVVYKAEGLTIAAANSKGEGGGPFGSEDFLRLPDGTLFKENRNTGYNGTPEPLFNQIQTENGWPNYVWRLEYPSVPPQVNDLTLVIPILQNMPVGAAPENWEIPFRLKAAPPEMTFVPVTVLPVINASPTTPDGTPQPVPSNVSKLNGFTFQLDNVVEVEDGFVFTGNLSWDDSVFPSGKGILAESAVPTLTDTSGQQIPIESVNVNAPYGEHNAPWSYRTNRKTFTGPLTLTLPSINVISFPAVADFELDLGPNPQVGQTWEINRNFTVEGHIIRLQSIRMINPPTTCDAVGLEYEIKSDAPGASLDLTDVNPEPPTDQVCSGGGGGGGGGLVDPTISRGVVGYRSIPTGVHHYSVGASIPHEIDGPWQVQWTPPSSPEPLPTTETGACLTFEKWNQLSAQEDALPVGVGGKVVTTVNEGGLLPAIYISPVDGTTSTRMGTAAWPSLSTDGTRLAYSAGDGIHIHNLASGENKAIGMDGYRIIWSPDSSRMIYTTTSSLFVVNADGAGLQKVETGTAQVIAPMGWLPDNQTIVYSAMGGEGFNVKIHNLQNGETRDSFIIHNKAGYGSISPDGQWVVFTDRTFGAINWGIFISRLDGSERKLIAEPEVPTAFTSIWSPDGQWLILNTVNKEEKQIPILVNPFTCQTARLSKINGMVEGWSR